MYPNTGENTEGENKSKPGKNLRHLSCSSDTDAREPLYENA